jgi:transposase
VTRVEVEHDCPLRTIVEQQAAALALQAESIAVLQRELAQLKKAHIGPKSERMKMPSVSDSLGEAPSKESTEALRKARREAKKSKAPTERVEHKVPAAERQCPKCTKGSMSALGEGRSTFVYEYKPPQLVCVEHVQEVLRCTCGGHVVTAPGAPKVIVKGRYGASFLAHLVVAKCVDSIPIYRLEKEWSRQGIPMSRSTMNELLHRTAELLSPLSKALLEVIRHRPVVHADETRLRMQNDGTGKAKNGFVWTFGAADALGKMDVGYVFAATRSGDTARDYLEGTQGALVVDAYSGYNKVLAVSSRERAACHAHLRRYFHEALATAPIAQQAIDTILRLYRIEHDAKEQGILGSEAHRALRLDKSAKVREELRQWLDDQKPKHPPKSPIGIAIRYAQNQWTELGRFINSTAIPLDNNAAERALRRVALGRKNFLFVGGAEAGKNLAGLYSLVATCEARGINPFEYLSDVLNRLPDHPMAKVEELLPGAWAV